MLNSEILNWIKQEFQPVSLATPDETILQIISNGKRYFNTHSAYPVIRMFDAPTGTVRIQLDTDYKDVIRVYPSTSADWALNSYPMWSLLGISAIDNLTTDLIILAEAYKNYRYYMGADFNWKYVKSEDPTVGGWLYMTNIPAQSTKLAVLGSYRIVDAGSGENEVEIKSEHILDWLLSFVKAQVKMVEGNTLRKSGAIGITNDGQELINEGQAELEELKTRIAVEGRWTAFVRRF